MTSIERRRERVANGSRRKRDLDAVAADAADLWQAYLDHYRETTDRKKVRGSVSAWRSFKARLHDGYTLDDLKLATVGCHSDPWLRKRCLDVPDTILRSKNVDRYIEMGKAHADSEPARRLPDREQLASHLDELTAVWPAVTALLREAVPESTYELWLAPLSPIGYDGTDVYLAATEEVRAWVERRYTSLIRQALARELPRPATGELKFGLSFVSAEEWERDD